MDERYLRWLLNKRGSDVNKIRQRLKVVALVTPETLGKSRRNTLKRRVLN